MDEDSTATGTNGQINFAPYISDIDIKYYHNQPAIKSPMNWNNALDKATGDYVMLLHQDDWLHDENTKRISNIG